ncbi:hypothetical protein C8J57DRAFT_1501995 [Mycena rebaudengoi]|nr:hypothetical protein C8J57DRAFT_1501995 [Mycena rebaudengoi]
MLRARGAFVMTSFRDRLLIPTRLCGAYGGTNFLSSILRAPGIIPRTLSALAVHGAAHALSKSFFFRVPTLWPTILLFWRPCEPVISSPHVCGAQRRPCFSIFRVPAGTSAISSASRRSFES